MTAALPCAALEAALLALKPEGVAGMTVTHKTYTNPDRTVCVVMIDLGNVAVGDCVLGTGATVLAAYEHALARHADRVGKEADVAAGIAAADGEFGAMFGRAA